jgi:hypothetical protein
LTAIVGVLAIVVCASWALKPLQGTSHTDAPALTEVPPAEVTSSNKSAIDVAQFASVKLWNPVPDPPKPEVKVAKAEPKPLRLQLIGIIDEAGERKAALYDQDEDRLLIVASGAKVRQSTITQITTTAVTISTADSTHTLRLQEAGS